MNEKDDILKAPAPDFDKYIRMDSWRLEEAIGLICNCKPGYYDKFRDPVKNETTECMEFVYVLLDRGDPESYGVEDLNEVHLFEYNPWVKPSTFLAWAKSKDLKIPDELAVLLETDELQQGDSSYLDPNHEFYSKELAIAIKTWMTLFDRGNIKTNRSFKRQIVEWLNQNHGTLSNTAIKRIATVINPKKEGGAPPSD